MKHKSTSQNEARTEGSDAQQEAKGYMVFNATDGIWADAEPMTLAEACDFVEAFPTRFETQGYYKTASCRRIAPEQVELVIVPTPDLFASNGGCPKCGRTCQAIDMECRRWEFCDADRIRWSTGAASEPDMSAEMWHSVADRVYGYRIVTPPLTR